MRAIAGAMSMYASGIEKSAPPTMGPMRMELAIRAINSAEFRLLVWTIGPLDGDVFPLVAVYPSSEKVGFSLADR